MDDGMMNLNIVYTSQCALTQLIMLQQILWIILRID